MPTYRCPKCGHEYDAGLLFCGNCGTPNNPAQRIHQIEQMLQGEAAPPAPANPPLSGVAAPAPEAYAPSGAVPPPSGAPSIVLQDVAARKPAAEPEAAPVKKNPNRLIKWIALAVAAILVIVGAAGLIRQTLLGYHASPERLFAGFRKALEEEDGELMMELIQPEQVEQYTFDESTILDQIYIPDGELKLLDVMEGKKGKVAYIFVTFREDTTSYSNYLSSNLYRMSLTLTACKQDGKWYLNYTTTFFR